jgi:hypothetical protein
VDAAELLRAIAGQPRLGVAADIEAIVGQVGVTVGLFPVLKQLTGTSTSHLHGSRHPGRPTSQGRRAWHGTRGGEGTDKGASAGGEEERAAFRPRKGRRAGVKPLGPSSCIIYMCCATFSAGLADTNTSTYHRPTL